jgi:hypothetical protein
MSIQVSINIFQEIIALPKLKLRLQREVNWACRACQTYSPLSVASIHTLSMLSRSIAKSIRHCPALKLVIDSSIDI